MINVGNATYIENQVNFEKCGMLWDVASRMLKFQKVHYDISPIPMLYTYLYNLQASDESLLYQISIKLEPPVSSVPQ